jgi:deoxyribonuclease IV
MLFGVHVSIADGIFNAPANAQLVGGEVFQFFSRSPRGGQPSQLDQSTINKFKQKSHQYKLKESYIHAPYYINLASKQPRIRWGSIAVLKEELQRGTQLGVKYMMTHLGSAKDYGRKKSVEKVISAISYVLKKYQGSTQFLLEQAAGAGGDNGIIGGSLTELAYIYKAVVKLDSAYKKQLGICIDTCHAFAYGYDLRTKAAVNKFVREIDKTVGIKNIKLFHLNDSKFGLGEYKDRHEHIGRGQIGQSGFLALVNHPQLKHINAVIETPKDNGQQVDKINLTKLKKMRGHKI